MGYGSTTVEGDEECSVGIGAYREFVTNAVAEMVAEKAVTMLPPGREAVGGEPTGCGAQERYGQVPLDC